MQTVKSTPAATPTSAPPGPTQQTVFVLLEDKPGAMHRAVTLFRRRGYNIASLNVERSEVAGVSRMTVVIEAPSAGRVVTELERLIDVLAARDITQTPAPDVRTLLTPRMQADGVCDDELVS